VTAGMMPRITQIRDRHIL